VDGTYGASPISTTFGGMFEGLGNTISNLRIDIPDNGEAIGLFATIKQGGQVRSLGLENIDFEGSPLAAVGSIAGSNVGLVSRSWANGLVRIVSGETNSGGLIGANFGQVVSSHTSIRFRISSVGLANLGQLVGENEGTIALSYATGSMKVGQSREVSLGGLVGLNDGLVENSYTIVSLFGGSNCCNTYLGELIGDNQGQIESTYAAGGLATKSGDTSGIGGLVGFDGAAQGNIVTSYWDLDTGVADPSQGAGNIKNDSGITGLTTQQFQSGLPDGFDPKVWGADSRTNNGFPFLLTNPTR